MIAKLLYLPVLAAGLLAPTSGAFPSPISAHHTPAPSISTIPRTVVVSSTRSEFEKEQAMSPAQLMDRWAPLIKEASHRFEVSEAWIRAVMRMESGGRTLLDDKRPITSNAGAMGIMQMMPDTYQEMRHQYGLAQIPTILMTMFLPEQPIFAGSR